MEPTVDSTSILESPEKLGEWAGEWFLRRRSRAEDYQFAPDEEFRRDFAVSAREVERGVTELSVLRIAGACVFVKDVFSDKFYLRFLASLPVQLEAFAEKSAAPENRSSYLQALEQYVAFVAAEDGRAVHRLYLERVYGDNPNYVRLAAAGIGRIADEFIKAGIEAFSVGASELRGT
jgi:hypothetical protein